VEPRQIVDPAGLDQALGAEAFLLFKRSPTCPISARAWTAYRRFLRRNPDVRTGWIDVVAHADLARQVAERTGVEHESPQALWLRHGRVGWHASHFDVTERGLERAAASLPRKAG
jgi:bacillithiol system protein YtxJ